MSKRAYNRVIYGPDIDQPFSVTRGAVVVYGQTGTVLIPTGATWPGTGLLPADLRDRLRPDSSEGSSDLHLGAQPPTAQDIAFGVTLVQVQLLRTPRLPHHERLLLLGQLTDISKIPWHTTASMIGMTRQGLDRARQRLLH